jgi:hypothetical protein
MFFQSANRLSLDGGEELDESVGAIRRVKADQTYIERCLGVQAGKALQGFISGIESFLTSCRDGEPTPKGNAILEVVQGSFGRLLVTGSRQSRHQASAFLAANGLDNRCSLATEVAEDMDLSGVIAFSILREDIFARFIDPWPAPSIDLVGYDFEVDVYKKRLRRRERQKVRLDLDEELRSSLTSMPASRFAAKNNHDVLLPLRPQTPPETDLTAFDAATGIGHWNWLRRISIPHASPGEASQPATVVRFVGRSWMPMTEDHRALCLVGPSGGRAKSACS